MFVRRCLSELTSKSRSVLIKGRFPSSMNSQMHQFSDAAFSKSCAVLIKDHLPSSMNSQRALHSAPFISSMWMRFSTPTLEAIPSFLRKYYGLVIFLAPWTYYTIKRGPAYSSDRGFYFKRPFVDKSKSLEHTKMKDEGATIYDVLVEIDKAERAYDMAMAALWKKRKTELKNLLAKQHALLALQDEVMGKKGVAAASKPGLERKDR